MDIRIEDRLVLKNPSPQTALDIFKGLWVSKLPGEYISGQTPLFNDPRIPECTQFLGPITGKRVLDLGPLEGGQAYVLEQMGAKSIVSVEANSILYIKCLIAKEILGMSRTRFLCGDVIEYLKNTTEQFDLCIASGILYHMIDPVGLLWLISQRINQLMIWTHYYDNVNLSRNKLPSFKETRNIEFNKVLYTYYKQEYGVGFINSTYCGGTFQHSNWMSKDGILTALVEFGFKYNNLNIIQDGDSINGPFLLLTANK